jgi:hypothetical protein
MEKDKNSFSTDVNNSEIQVHIGFWYICPILFELEKYEQGIF